MRASRQARVLDVGCGSGRLVLDLKKLGYENLLGVDLFIPKAIDYGNGVRVMKGGLEDLAGTTWDVIMFHHSFEHMPDPARVLRLTADLLSPNGHCLIRIPVVASAWEQYRADWVQLDAPRHLFLQTEKSFQLLAHGAGLRMYKVIYDSNEFQFWASELYGRDIPLRQVSAREVKSLLGAAQMGEYRRRALEMNDRGVGDQAAFYLALEGNEAPADSVARE
jgi:SAM-dependent methyltransferase